MFKNQPINYQSIRSYDPVKFDLGFVIPWPKKSLINSYRFDEQSKYNIFVRTTSGSELEVKPASNSFLQIPLLGEHVLIFYGYSSNSDFQSRKRTWYYWPLYPIQNDINENSLPEAFGPKTNDNQTVNIPDNIKLGETFQSKIVPAIQLYEGDTILQGRFGNTIRLGSSQQQNNAYSESQTWKSNNGSPLMILSVSDSENANSFRVENIESDNSSIWLTSNQTLSGNINLSKNLSNHTSAATFSNSQLIGSADRVVLQSKKDSIIFDAAEDIVMSTKKLYIGSDTANIPMVDTIELVSLLREMITILLIPYSTSTGTPIIPSSQPTGQLSSLLSRLENLKINKFKIEK